MSGRDLDSVLDQIIDEEHRPHREGLPSLIYGQVVAVNVGPPKSLNVTISGTLITGIRYADSITAAGALSLGDVVLITSGDDPVALCRIA